MRHLMRLMRLFAAGPVDPMPRPDPPICVIGDVHGMAGLLDSLLKVILDQPSGDKARVVLVGDLIDRGPQSAEVLARVRALCTAEPGRFACVMGNHERMMLDFLADPPRHAARWLRAGGAATLQSYGITQRFDGPDASHRFTAMAEALRCALPDGLLGWLQDLPLFWQADGLTVVHADADLSFPLADQPEARLLWGRGRRTSGPGWLAHGHVIQADPTALHGRIGVDTGAYRGGGLSAVWLDAWRQEFLRVGRDK